jgi:hypothetical protein
MEYVSDFVSFKSVFMFNCGAVSRFCIEV